ncbi:MAG: hypothetical protein HFF48_03810 [Lawsonibacter sp.]|nr:hypothetical protein [Lawsonibacter sp.]
MSDQEKKKNKGDLIDIKSLIGDADGGGYSLDDIMAEYGHPTQPEPPRAQPARGLKPGGKVVAFPGPPPRKDPEPPPQEPQPPEPDPQPAPVIPFPQEESALSAFIKDLGKKADDYADHMFEEDEAIDKQEVRRLERLIPGTDQEEVDEDAPSRRQRRPRRQEPPPPDIPPQELARRYGRGLKWLRLRTLFVLLLAVLSLVQTLLPLWGAVWSPPMDQPEVQCWLSAALMGMGILLSADVLLTGLLRACFLKFGMDTMAALACLLTLADGVQLATGESQRLPYTLVCLTGLFFLLHGVYHKRCALRLSCRTAASTATPYRVTLDPEKWNDRGTYAKWSGDNQGYGSQIQTDDGAQRIFRRVCPLLLVGDVTCALMASVGNDHPERLIWALSALFTVTAAFGGGLAYSRPFHKAARRLAPSGAALAGWPGMSASRRGDCVLITDGDLFPPGYVELNGFKVMAEFPAERVVAYTATLIRDSGSGLTKLFHDQLRSMGGLMRRADSLVCHEGGGLSANIRGEQVLVGSAAFMKLMEVKLPQGLNVKSAVFCAIDRRLAGIFALSYALPDTVFPALESLMLEKVEPVLATRDFNLIPAMLQQRFKLAADKMAFPPVERRRQLSDPEQDHGDTLTALLCREGLLPFAEAITTAKRLRWAARLGAALCCAASLLGMALAAYLTSVGAYTSLSPLNLLVYMLTWLAPVWFLSGWVHRF